MSGDYWTELKFSRGSLREMEMEMPNEVVTPDILLQKNNKSLYGLYRNCFSAQIIRYRGQLREPKAAHRRNSAYTLITYPGCTIIALPRHDP